MKGWSSFLIRDGIFKFVKNICKVFHVLKSFVETQIRWRTHQKQMWLYSQCLIIFDFWFKMNLICLRGQILASGYFVISYNFSCIFLYRRRCEINIVVLTTLLKGILWCFREFCECFCLIFEFCQEWPWTTFRLLLQSSNVFSVALFGYIYFVIFSMVYLFLSRKQFFSLWVFELWRRICLLWSFFCLNLKV